jgi:hypothetical protein
MMNNATLLELYYAIARMGLGMGGIAYDLNLPRSALRARGT